MRPKFGVVVLTMGNRPDDLKRGLPVCEPAEVDLDVVVVGNGGSRWACRTGEGHG